MNREDQEQPAANVDYLLSSNVTTEDRPGRCPFSAREPSETIALKEKDLGKTETSDETSWRLFYKDANAAKYVIIKC
jgi:hypothetical protein